MFYGDVTLRLWACRKERGASERRKARRLVESVDCCVVNLHHLSEGYLYRGCGWVLHFLWCLCSHSSGLCWGTAAPIACLFLGLEPRVRDLSSCARPDSQMSCHVSKPCERALRILHFNRECDSAFWNFVANLWLNANRFKLRLLFEILLIVNR